MADANPQHDGRSENVDHFPDGELQEGRQEEQLEGQDEQQLGKNPDVDRLQEDTDSRPPLSPLSGPPPSMRSVSDTPAMTASSTPLGNVAAARGRPPPPPRGAVTTGSSGLTQDIQAKMKAFSLSRQGVPTGPNPSNPSLAPSAQNLVGGGIGGNVLANNPAAVARLPGGISVAGAGGATPPPTMSGPPKMGGPLKIGGLAAKRGMKGGMKLSDVGSSSPGGSSPAGPAGAPAPSRPPSGLSESAFSRYSDIIDTKAGTLKFKDKALLHKSGVDFLSGNSFKISLDDVETLDELGKGNYGTVYKVRHCKPKLRHPGLGLRGSVPSRQSSAGLDTQPVVGDGSEKLTNVIMAMKEIRLELDDAKFDAIITELDILHRCVSPFIIDFYGAFFQEGAVYICVEYMDGGSMEKLYREGVPENILRKIALSTVMGLKTLKDDHHIIHRDVKPTNILVNTRGQVKICDFGVSGNLVASIAKTNIGCQSYMAPERIAGGAHAPNPTGGTYSVQSDIWSLGVTLVECAKGGYPYPPDTYTNIFSQLNVGLSACPRLLVCADSYQAIVKGEPPQLPDEGYSDEAKDFVRSCLNKNASLRPSYARLLRHPWLAPLMEPPSSEQGNVSQALSDSPLQSSNPILSADYPAYPAHEVVDKEVSDWVRGCIEGLINSGSIKARPALHAVALDAVPGSPLLENPSAFPE